MYSVHVTKLLSPRFLHQEQQKLIPTYKCKDVRRIKNMNNQFPFGGNPGMPTPPQFGQFQQIQ
jgi:hypothetical protein